MSVKETNNCDIGTSGISSFKSDPVGAAKFVAKHPCLLNSIYQIPQSSTAQSSIDLVSTAGMRIIRLADPIIAGRVNYGVIIHQLKQKATGHFRMSQSFPKLMAPTETARCCCSRINVYLYDVHSWILF